MAGYIIQCLLWRDHLSEYTHTHEILCTERSQVQVDARRDALNSFFFPPLKFFFCQKSLFSFKKILLLLLLPFELLNSPTVFYFQVKSCWSHNTKKVEEGVAFIYFQKNFTQSKVFPFPSIIKEFSLRLLCSVLCAEKFFSTMLCRMHDRGQLK